MLWSQAWSLVSGVSEEANGCFSLTRGCFSPSLSPYLRLSLKINKENLQKNTSGSNSSTTEFSLVLKTIRNFTVSYNSIVKKEKKRKKTDSQIILILFQTLLKNGSLLNSHAYKCNTNLLSTKKKAMNQSL